MNIYENIRLIKGVYDKKAAMYYKTEPFWKGYDQYQHTNNWEIVAAIQILNSKGYTVDLIDRSCKNWTPKVSYDAFIGLGVGNSGSQFVKYAKASKAPVKILLAMGPQPDISNEKVIARYELFRKRTGINAPPMRTVTDVLGDKFKEIVDVADVIFVIGEPGTESYKSYLTSGKPIETFFPGTNPALYFTDSLLDTRDLNSYLCFAGNGLICKGVDLVFEAFMNMPDKNLTICGPLEDAFAKYYLPKIKEFPNIKYEGFVTHTSNAYKDIIATCAYSIFHSSSEGCCTSVATTMRSGLPPVINPWTSVHVNEKFGFSMSDEGDLIKNIEETVKKASSITAEEYKNLVKNTVSESEKYTQKSHIQTFTKALNNWV